MELTREEAHGIIDWAREAYGIERFDDCAQICLILRQFASALLIVDDEADEDMRNDKETVANLEAIQPICEALEKLWLRCDEYYR